MWLGGVLSTVGMQTGHPPLGEVAINTCVSVQGRIPSQNLFTLIIPSELYHNHVVMEDGWCQGEVSTRSCANELVPPLHLYNQSCSWGASGPGHCTWTCVFLNSGCPVSPRHSAYAPVRSRAERLGMHKQALSSWPGQHRQGYVLPLSPALSRKKSSLSSCLGDIFPEKGLLFLTCLNEVKRIQYPLSADLFSRYPRDKERIIYYSSI